MSGAEPVNEVRRTALITGSGRNIGRAVALRLAADGFNVVVNGSKDQGAVEAVAGEARALGAAFGVEALAVIGDVGVAAQADRIAGEALDRFGVIDVLVNNAAIRPLKPFLEISGEEWARVMAVDLEAAVWLSRACLPGMVERGWGRIINFAGMNSIQGDSGRSHVSVAKHGAWGLAKSLAKEFGPLGITANVISPGPIRADGDDGRAPEAVKSRVPAGRKGEAVEIAAAVAMLVSDLGAYTNGQLIQVNGGAQT